MSLSVVGMIWQLALLASVLGFWPSVFLIFSVWESQHKAFPLSNRIRQWFPIIVYPWVVSVAVFLAIFLYLAFFVAPRQ